MCFIFPLLCGFGFPFIAGSKPFDTLLIYSLFHLKGQFPLNIILKIIDINLFD
jgi:hypothetical protein